MPRPGRKSLFRKEMIEEGYKLGALGMTMEEIADFWNVGRNTLWRYCKRVPELQTQISKGKNEADMTVVQALLQQCKEGNVTATIFWLKNRRGHEWSDMKNVNVKGMKGTTVNVDNSKHFQQVIQFSDTDDDLEDIYDTGNDDEDQAEVYATEGKAGNRCEKAL